MRFNNLSARRAYYRAASRKWRIKNPGYAAVYYAANKEKQKTYGAAYRASHITEGKVKHVRRFFNISQRDATLLVALRDGEAAWCDICHTTQGRFVIDHDHQTRRIRGILCHPCNHLLEAIETDGFLEAAGRYLR